MAMRRAYDNLEVRWLTFNAPPLSDVLQSLEKTPADERCDLAALDLGERVRTGQDVRAETYLEQSSLSHLTSSEKMDVICTELYFRRDIPSQTPPSLEEYELRFPDLADEIRKQFEFDSILDETGIRGEIEGGFDDLFRTKDRFDLN